VTEWSLLACGSTRACMVQLLQLRQYQIGTSHDFSTAEPYYLPLVMFCIILLLIC
jgi:hypothetical protein